LYNNNVIWHILYYIVIGLIGCSKKQKTVINVMIVLYVSDIFSQTVRPLYW